MRVLLTSHGSTGDIVPMISLGCALLNAGHAVRFATTPFFKDDIEGAGLEFVRLPPDWDAEKFKQAMHDLHRAKTPLRQLRIIYGSARPHMAETLSILRESLSDTDLLVGSYLFPEFRSLAKQAGSKFAVVSFCHNTVASVDQPPDMVPSIGFLPKSWQRVWNRAFWDLCEGVLDKVMEQELGDVLREAALPIRGGFCWEPAELALVAVSPALMLSKGVQAAECFRFTGYLRYQNADDPAMEAQLSDFTNGERVPIITFGSVSWDKAQAEMEQFLSNWPSERKLILQAGWAGFTEDRANVLTVKKCSHDQLFRFASVVMHHGGAGTTASVLHAGIPHLIAPQIADQNFWAKQVQRLGVGLRASPRSWPKQAPRLLQKLETDQAFNSKAITCAETLAQEDGPGNAVRELESYQQA